MSRARLLLVAAFVSLPALPGVAGLPVPPALKAQPTFEQTIADLSARDAATRLRAVQLLKESAYPEAAEPLAAAINDTDDAVQLEAIGAELNLFLAEKVVQKKRVGLVVELRNRVSAEAVFMAGPSALDFSPVPFKVITALWAAAQDPSDRVAAEALYAFGALAGDATGAARAELLSAISPELAATIGVHDPARRLAAVRVIGRLYGYRPGDGRANESIGDAVITALNDKETGVRTAAMAALAAMRYGRAVQALTELFQYYKTGPLAEASFNALAHIGHGASQPLFVAQLKGKNTALKAIGIEGLARMGDRAQASAIDASLQSERNESVLLAGHFANVMLSNAPVDQLAEALLRPKMHDQALAYVVEVAPGRALAFLRHARDPEARLRLDIVNALGLSGDRAALPIAEPLMQDREPQVAAAAARAVARLRAATRRAS